MNENDKTQEQQDAAEVERMRIGLSTFGAFAPEYYRAAINTIDALTAERDRLRALLDGVPQILDDAIAIIPPNHSNGVKLYRDWQRKAAAIRAALDAPAPADGSGDAADGSAGGGDGR